jgi:hypothetical protein
MAEHDRPGRRKWQFGTSTQSAGIRAQGAAGSVPTESETLMSYGARTVTNTPILQLSAKVAIRTRFIFTMAHCPLRPIIDCYRTGILRTATTPRALSSRRNKGRLRPPSWPLVEIDSYGRSCLLCGPMPTRSELTGVGGERPIFVSAMNRRYGAIRSRRPAARCKPRTTLCGGRRIHVSSES